MQLTVGQIVFVAPDTTTPDDFVKWVDQLLLRLDKLTNFAVTVSTGQASTPSAATPSSSASAPATSSSQIAVV